MPGNPLTRGPTARDPDSAVADRRPWHRRPDWLVVAVPVVAALALGGYRLGGPSLWRDEAYTIIAARRSAGQILVLLGHVDAVHGPYYLCMHVVVGLLGTSAVAIRLPSLLAMSIAAGYTAALGRRLAATSGLSTPSVTGLLAGLLFAAGPRTTYYAQDARPYGLVVMFAVIATYLLIRATADGRWRWWAAYSAAISLAGIFNVFALLLVIAHGVTLALARAPTRGGQPDGGSGPAGRPAAAAGTGRPGGQPAAQQRTRLSRWLVAVAAAGVVLAPMIYLGYQQRQTLGWVTRPGIHAVARTVTDFAGSRQLIPLVAIIALGGTLAGRRSRRPGQPALTVTALPWLVLPPLILISVSQIHPAYVERYVILCIPALALLCAAGLAGLARLGAMIPAARTRPALAWAPAAVILAVLAVLLIGPQHLAGPAAGRPDDLRAAAAVVAANERPGDAVFYVPAKTRVVSIAYPAPFRRLRDVALAKSPAISSTLVGTPVQPSTLRGRFASVRRVWLIQWWRRHFARPKDATGQAELTLVEGMHLVRRWHARSMVLSLYVVEPQRPRDLYRKVTNAERDAFAPLPGDAGRRGGHAAGRHEDPGPRSCRP